MGMPVKTITSRKVWQSASASCEIAGGDPVMAV
jgi:hypothetical protein